MFYRCLILFHKHLYSISCLPGTTLKCLMNINLRYACLFHIPKLQREETRSSAFSNSQHSAQCIQKKKNLRLTALSVVCKKFQHDEPEFRESVFNRLTDTENRLVVASADLKLPILPSPPANYYTEWIDNKVLLHSTGNCIRYSVTNHNGKEMIKCICMTELPCSTAEISTTL